MRYGLLKILLTGNNTTDTEMYYKLTLVVDSNTFTMSDPLQYELVSTNTSTNGEVIPTVDKTDVVGLSIELGKGHFIKANNARHTYQLKIYYPNKTTSQNDNQNASFSAHVEITSVKQLKTNGILSELILHNNDLNTPLTIPGAEVSAYLQDDINDTSTVNVISAFQTYYFTYGTGWEANGINFNLTGATVTSDTYANSYSDLVGKYLASSSVLSNSSNKAGQMKKTTDLKAVYYVVSATHDSFTYKSITSNKNTTEALLASTDDDYGISYYFRGNVKNNYVQFANKCWRIVRVSGNKTVKLILHNDNISNSSDPCASANNSTSAAFAHYNGDTYISAFNTNYDDNAYIGFMYGTAGSDDYTSTHTNTNKSIVLTNLETWYTNNLASSEDKIANTVWCNDKTNVTDNTFDPWKWNPNGFGYRTSVTYSETVKRLVDANSNAGGTGPILKCSGELNRITSKIGLLSADEIAFAGYAYGLYSYGNYLQENAINTYWWSLSPTGFYNNRAYVWFVLGESGLFDGYYVDSEFAIRPSISLVSTIEATGSGTSEDPYVVK